MLCFFSHALFFSLKSDFNEWFDELQSTMREEGRDKVDDKRPFILQLGTDYQRGRRRRRPLGVNQRVQNWMASDVQKLGTELAEQQLLERTESLFPNHHQRRPHCHQLQRRSGQLAVRPDIRGGPVLK